MDWSKYESSNKLEVLIMTAKKRFEWKILLKKLGINCGIIFIAGLAVHYGDNPYYLAVAPALKALENFFKHYND